MSSVESVGRMLLALAVVLFVVWLLGRAVRRSRRPSDGLVDVLARKQLSRNASLAVVRVADRAMVIGVTDSAVSLIGETDLARVQRPVVSARPTPAPVPPVPPPTSSVAGPLTGSALSPATWKQSVQALRELTVRRP